MKGALDVLTGTAVDGPHLTRLFQTAALCKLSAMAE
jgi:hypothetical protein